MYECKGEHAVISSQRWRTLQNCYDLSAVIKLTPAELLVHADQHSASRLPLLSAESSAWQATESPRLVRVLKLPGGILV